MFAELKQLHPQHGLLNEFIRWTLSDQPPPTNPFPLSPSVSPVSSGAFSPKINNPTHSSKKKLFLAPFHPFRVPKRGSFLSTDELSGHLPILSKKEIPPPNPLFFAEDFTFGVELHIPQYLTRIDRHNSFLKMQLSDVTLCRAAVHA